MFIKTESGALINLRLVGEISIGPHHQNEAQVRAFTGAGNEDNPAVWAELYAGSRNECATYIDDLYNRLAYAGMVVPKKLDNASYKLKPEY